MDCSLPGSSVSGISQQECWSGLPFPPQADLPDPGINPKSPASPALQMDSLHWVTWEGKCGRRDKYSSEKDSKQHMWRNKGSRTWALECHSTCCQQGPRTNAKISEQILKNRTCSESQSVSPQIIIPVGFSFSFPFALFFNWSIFDLFCKLWGTT